MGKVILTIDDIAPDRDRISVHGKEYELKTLDDFGLVANAEVRRLGNAIVADMQQVGSMDESGLADFETRLNAFLGKLIIGISPDEIAAMPYKHRASCLVAFWKSVVEMSRLATEATKAIEGRQTGATS